MNKSQGATAGAAIILAAGALLRPSAQNNVPESPPSPVIRQSAATYAARGEGPWKASCAYWAPVRSEEVAAAEKPARIAFTVTGSEAKLDSHLQVSADQSEAPCDGSSDPWGIPAKLPDGKTPEITAIVATVPDPERGHLELDFDRTVDALLQAASDNGDVGSYFWLPWKASNERELKSTSTGVDSSREEAERLRQPGLIILKDGSVNDGDPGLSFRRVIYVFLVASTPTQGVNGEQLQRAFNDEAYLLSKPRTTLSMRDRPASTEAPAPTAKGKKTQLQERMPSQQPISGPRDSQSHPPRAASPQQPTGEMDLLLFNYSGSAASMREGIQAALVDAGNRHPLLSTRTIKTVSIAGATSTEVAGTLLTSTKFGNTQIRYTSFLENTSVEEAEVTNLFQDEPGKCDGIAFLTESGTVFGSSSASGVFAGNARYRRTKREPRLDETTAAKAEVRAEKAETDTPVLSACHEDPPLVLNFPRDISLLRNATAREGEKSRDTSGDVVSPYLHFSLGGSDAEDSIPHFSAEDTPLSQEAQLMAIGRRLAHSHIRTIAIGASNILDAVFLAQFLHRACPDARLVFLGGGDLLIEREAESAQYVGAITLSPYNLVNLDHDFFTPRHLRAFGDSQSEAFYNAASFTFWDRDSRMPRLAGYPLYASQHVLRPLLWATTVGRDGYYALGILNPCTSSTVRSLPDITVPQDASDGYAAPCTNSAGAEPPTPFEPGVRVHPSMFWFALCILVILLCVGHGAVLLTANFWSPLTRDLAIESGDMPRRRAVYVNIASAMLFCLGFVVAYPFFPVFRVSMLSANAVFWAVLTLLAACASLFATLVRTCSHIGPTPEDPLLVENCDRCDDGKEAKPAKRKKNFYPLIHAIAFITLFAVPITWVFICESNQTVGTHTFAGLFFSYRCLHPETGVSPLVPIVLLLFGWYLWGLFQTLRLRFSVNGRPQLPCKVDAHTAYPFYVSEEALSHCESSQSACLYKNITCLLITREVVRRFFRGSPLKLDAMLVTGYFGLFTVAVILVHVQSLDHFLWKVGFWPTPYEFLIRALFFPLVMVALTGWVRVIFVWNSLRRGLLEPLERLPIRFAFTRLHGVAWMTMLRQGGLEEYWRDMARSTEAMRQMSNSEDLMETVAAVDEPAVDSMRDTYQSLKNHIAALSLLVQDNTPRRRREDCDLRPKSRAFLVGSDIPGPMFRDELNLMSSIERDYAHFCEILLTSLLIPYWDKQRTGFVEGEPMEMMPIRAKRAVAEAAPDALELHASPHDVETEPIRFAEEFLAIRYVSVIRAVLVNLRYLMMFISMAFVLAIIAWNSYPFRPRHWVDWMFTSVLVVLGAGIVWVFAQMYRNPILSRITDTSANELGIEFYLRLATFGAVPLLTWLASQFPSISSGIMHLIKPGLEVVK